MAGTHTLWPELAYPRWRDTAVTLHLWMQIVGKVRLALTPWVNHSWQVPFYVSARGLTTSPIPIRGEIFEVEFDFVEHHLSVRTSAGADGALPLQPQSVAAFYADVMALLRDLGYEIEISQKPSEVPDPVLFSRDEIHTSYDPRAAHAFWRVLLQADRLLKVFRSGFLGKVSPVHFFWGSFDLAVTRFSGRTAPPHPGGVPGLSDAVVREAYSHELSSAGFWPGNDTLPSAAFYSYAYPEPPGFRNQSVGAGAFNPKLGEFILPYDAVRAAEDPDRLVFEFLSGTYKAAAASGKWDGTQLECAPGVPGVVRKIPTHL
jgi:hypothetical protein